MRIISMTDAVLQIRKMHLNFNNECFLPDFLQTENREDEFFVETVDFGRVGRCKFSRRQSAAISNSLNSKICTLP